MMTKSALICPASMVTESGALTSDEALLGSGNSLNGSTAASATKVSVGTVSSNVTMPLLATPPFTVEGNNVRLRSIPIITFGFTVNVQKMKFHHTLHESRGVQC